MTYAQDGNLARFSDGEIARFGAWPGEPGTFVEALRSAGWIEPDGCLHDWQDYAGHFITAAAKAQKERERKKADREAQRLAIQQVKASADVLGSRPRTVLKTSAHTVPNPTLPDLTGPDHEAKTRHQRAGAPELPAIAGEAVSEEQREAARLAIALRVTGKSPVRPGTPIDTPLPEDFAPDDDNRKLCGELRLDIRHQLGAFKSFYESRGERRENWQKAFAFWLYSSFNKSQHGKGRPVSPGVDGPRAITLSPEVRDDLADIVPAVIAWEDK